jgi:hypothetical protein
MASTKEMQLRAKLRKQLVKGPTWAQLRPLYVADIKKAQKVYMTKLTAADRGNIMQVMKDADNERMNRAVIVGTNLVRCGIASIEQVKNAAWEGYNGLMEACCVEMNIQHNLGLPVTQPNLDDFIITGPDAVEKALARGMFA